MTEIDRPEGHDPSEEPHHEVAIGINPDTDEGISVRREQDGGYTIFLRGEISIAIRPNVAYTLFPETAGALLSGAEEPSEGLVPERTETICQQLSQRAGKSIKSGICNA